MCDHQRTHALPRGKKVRQFQHLLRRCRIKRRRMFVQKQKLRICDDCHKQRQRLPLSSGEQLHLLGHAVFESHAEQRELFAEQLAVFFGDAGLQTARPVLVIGNRQILFDRHVKGRTLEWILKHAADLSGALVFRLFGDVPAVQRDTAAVDGKHARDAVEQGRFARAVVADDGDEITLVHAQADIRECRLFIDGARTESFAYLIDVQ